MLNVVLWIYGKGKVIDDMQQILKKLSVLLDRKQKRAMAGLIVLMVIGAALQTAGVGIIVPVMSTIMDSSAIESNGVLNYFYRLLGGGSKERL